MDVEHSSETLIITTRTHGVTSRKIAFLIISVFLYLTALNPDVSLWKQRNKDQNENNTAYPKAVAWQYQIDDT
jgi:hypothetical protein